MAVALKTILSEVVMSYVFSNSDLKISKHVLSSHSLYFVFTLGRGGGNANITVSNHKKNHYSTFAIKEDFIF